MLNMLLLQRVLRVAKNIKVLERSSPCKNIQFLQKAKKHYALSTRIFTASPFIAMGIWGFKNNKGGNEKIITKELLLLKADALYDQQQYKQIYELLSNYRDSEDVDILWRLCRALYRMSKTANEVEAKKMIYEGYDLLSTALNIKENNWAVHKWMAIFLDGKCNYEGMKVRIAEVYNIKKHMMRAAELNPEDPTILYMIGNWCFQVSNLAWYQRKIATVVFGEPPTSSFEEALTYFERAERTDPNFYSHNLLMLGKTYLQLNRKQEALKYLKKAAEFPARNDDDHTAKQEAQNLLKNF